MLNTILLEQQIKAALDAESDVDVNPAEARSRTARAIAQAVETYIKAATINYVAGLVAPPGGGPVTGVFTGNIS